MNQVRYRYNKCHNSDEISEASSTTIPKHVNVLAKVNKSPCASLLNMTPRDDYSVTIHVLKMTILDIIHEHNE